MADDPGGLHRGRGRLPEPLQGADRAEPLGAGRLIDARFTLALAALLAAAGVAAWPLAARLPGGLAGLAAGLGFSLVSLALGMAGIRWGLARSPRHMMMALLGAMAARVVALLAFALVLAFATAANLAVGLLTVVAAHLVVGPAEIGYLKRTGAFR